MTTTALPIVVSTGGSISTVQLLNGLVSSERERVYIFLNVLLFSSGRSVYERTA